MHVKRVPFAMLASLLSFSAVALPWRTRAQNPPPPPAAAPAPKIQAPASPSHGAIRLTLDEAIHLALTHNHNLKAAQTTIQQNQAQEITAKLRPNPVFSADTQFLPIFDPDEFSESYIENTAQFDVGINYLFERGGKRQHRLHAAKDQTAMTTSQVADNGRTLTFTVAQQFINVQLAESTLDLAIEDRKSFQNTVDISQARYQAGDISEVDFLKIKLQLLQFQSDVSQAQLSKVQALVALRQFLGYKTVPEDFDVSGDFDYIPVKVQLEDLQAQALENRPDFRAALQGVTLAKSQYELAKANGKRDVTGFFNYTHVGAVNTADMGLNFQLPIFDRNQGEIARTNYAINQAQELELAANDQVLSDVLTAYEAMRDNDQVVSLYRAGYLDAAKQSRDITEYSYKRGAASLLDFLDAERSYRATELAYRQSLAAYLTAVEQLREAVGVRNLP